MNNKKYSPIIISDLNQKDFDTLILRETDKKNHHFESELGDINIFLNRCIHILNNGPRYLKDYSIEKLDAFFWFMIGGIDTMTWYFNQENTTQTVKMQFVAALEAFYFAVIEHSQVDEMPNGFYMLPDELANAINNDFEFEKQFDKLLEIDFHSPTQKVKSQKLHKQWYSQQSPEKQEFLDRAYAFFEACTASKDERLTLYGFHGMGHLYHPEKIKYIEDFLKTKGKNWPLESVEYLRRCQFSKIM